MEEMGLTMSGAASAMAASEPTASRPSAASVLDRRDLLVALLVALVTASMAGLVFTDQLTEDSATYARQILAPGDAYFHPHHLLYNAAVRWAALLSGALAPGFEPWTAVQALQWVNLAVSAVAPGLMYLVARRLTVPIGLALGLALGLGLAFRFLTFGSQIEVYNFALVALTLATLGLVLPERSRVAPWLVALGFFLGMGFHQTALFFGAAVLVMAWGRARPIRWLLIAFVLPGAAIGLSYLAIGLSLGHTTPSSFMLWLTAYAHNGSWGQGSASLGTLIDAVRGFSLAYGHGGGEFLVLALLLAVGVLAVTTGWQRNPARRRFVLAMAAFLAPLALFNAWWFGRNPEFWIMASLPVTASLAAMLGAAPTARGRLAHAAVGALVLAQAGFLTYQATIEHKAESIKAAMSEAAGVARPGDLLLAVDSRMVSYLDIQLLGREVTVDSLHLIAMEAQRSGKDVEQALAAAIAEQADRARAAGGRLVLDTALLVEGASRARGFENLDHERLRALLSPILEAAPSGGRFLPLP
jgi:hypothetical protein